MARAQRIFCEFCPNGRLDVGMPFCGDCGSPTMWASHDDRVQWEVGQWRRTRATSGGSDGRMASVSTIAPPARISALDVEVERINAVMSAAPLEIVEPQPAKPSFVAWFKSFVRKIRDMFDNEAAIVPPDVVVQPSPPGPAHEAIVPVEDPVAMIEEPVAIAEPIPLFDPEVELAPETVVATPEPAPAEVAAPEPPVVVEPPRIVPKPRPPRKRPQRPTNKDMLKSALDVLKKVEQRLENVELELAEIDGAVRTARKRNVADQKLS